MSREALQADEFTDLQTQKIMNLQSHKPKAHKLTNSWSYELTNSGTHGLTNSGTLNPKAHELKSPRTQRLINSRTQKKNKHARQTKLVSLELFENSNAFLWVGVRTEQTFHKPQQAKIHLVGVNDEELSHVFAVYAIQTWVV